VPAICFNYEASNEEVGMIIKQRDELFLRNQFTKICFFGCFFHLIRRETIRGPLSVLFTDCQRNKDGLAESVRDFRCVEFRES
jgi:hypothetical protein